MRLDALSCCELAWLVGILEGEGCFQVLQFKRGNARPCLRVEVKMCDLDVMQRVASYLGKALKTDAWESRPTHWKTAYRVYVNAAEAEALMLVVRPHMGKRRGAKIDELLGMKNLSHRPRSAVA